MLHLRHFAGRATLRALLIGSAAILAAGGGLGVAGRAFADPVSAQAAAPFVSDRLSVEFVGHRPDVILIPGMASSREVWRAEAERLRSTHRVHLVQLAGFAGEARTHGDGPFVQPAVDELARYIETRSLTSPAIFGHSMGGMSALMLAQQWPELVGKVMTVDSLPFFSALFGPTITVEQARVFADRMTATLLDGAEDTIEAAQTQGAVGYSRDPATRAAIVRWSMASDRRAMGAAMRDVMTTDLRPGLASLTVPVWALYASDSDGGAPAAAADEIWRREYAGQPAVRLIRVDDSRHFIMADQPARFAEIMDAFLAQ